MTNKTTVTAEPNKQELFITREFDAPREMVFEAFTNPEIFIKWWLAKENEMKIDVMDYQSGGKYRYTFTIAKGAKIGFNGMIHDVTSPERIIQTAEMEGFPVKGHVCLETMLFETLEGGKTKLMIQDVFQSVEDRDAAVATGMEHGLEEGFGRLESILNQKQTN